MSTSAPPRAEAISRVAVCCPTDGAELRDLGRDQGSECTGCGARFPEVRGVLRLADHTNEFYEGAYLNQVRFVPRSERWWHVWPLWLITHGFVWATRRYVNAGSTVVEMGCAGGVAYFGGRYRMIGLDVSARSLEGSARIYERCVQMDVSRGLPLGDESVDAVVSSFFWEHIPPKVKVDVLAECLRILRPGGKLVFLYDVETSNPLIARLKRQDAVGYRERFLEGDGHVGYESPAVNSETFRRAGFDVIEHRGYERGWLQSPSVYEKAAEWPGAIGLLGRAGRNLSRQALFFAYTTTLRILDELNIARRPLEHARIVLTVAEKPPSRIRA